MSRFKYGQRVKVTRQQELVARDSTVGNGYWVKGYLLEDIRAGNSIVLARDERNGVRIDGIFSTSPVVVFEDGAGTAIAYTENSIYSVEALEDSVTVLTPLEETEEKLECDAQADGDVRG